MRKLIKFLFLLLIPLGAFIGEIKMLQIQEAQGQYRTVEGPVVFIGYTLLGIYSAIALFSIAAFCSSENINLRDKIIITIPIIIISIPIVLLISSFFS